VMGFSSQPPSTDTCCTSGSYCWVLPLLSPALRWSVRTTPPSHTPEVLRSGPAGARGSAGYRSWELVCGLRRSCVLVGGYLNLAPPHQVGRRVLRDALGRHPSVDPRRWRPAGGPVTGAGLGSYRAARCQTKFASHCGCSSRSSDGRRGATDGHRSGATALVALPAGIDGDSGSWRFHCMLPPPSCWSRSKAGQRQEPRCLRARLPRPHPALGIKPPPPTAALSLFWARNVSST
jgi:hypothetical protein